MTAPVFSDALALFDDTVTLSVTGAELVVDLAPAGAVQSGMDFDALGSALLDFGQVAGDVGNVFAEDFKAVITEVLNAASLAAAIVTDILNAVKIAGKIADLAGSAAAAVAVATAEDTATVSSVLAQVQEEITTTAAALNTVFQKATDDLEAQVLGGQVVFQQDIDAVINSFPATVSDANESNTFLIDTLQNLLAFEQYLNTLFSEIDTNTDLEQPISLTGLNVLLVLVDAVILTDVAVAAASYASFALELYTGELFTVSAVGPYTVDVPTGATFVDMVLIGGGGGGGGYNTAGAGTGGDGGNTTATPAGGATLAAAGGAGGGSATGITATAGGSPGTEAFDGQTFPGGSGGTVGASSAGGNGAAPGGGGGGGANGSLGGAGGAAGVWSTQTITITDDITTISGSIGAGGASGAATNTFLGGTGGHGSAFFYFYI
jgi:hypothetical protein